jgi:hypothetical protein
VTAYYQRAWIKGKTDSVESPSCWNR